jgi:hypothetical protein
VIEVAPAAFDHARHVFRSRGIPLLPLLDQRTVEVRDRIAFDDPIPQVADRRMQRFEFGTRGGWEQLGFDDLNGRWGRGRGRGWWKCLGDNRNRRRWSGDDGLGRRGGARGKQHGNGDGREVS